MGRGRSRQGPIDSHSDIERLINPICVGACMSCHRGVVSSSATGGGGGGGAAGLVARGAARGAARGGARGALAVEAAAAAEAEVAAAEMERAFEVQPAVFL